jgi:hypothetical protein
MLRQEGQRRSGPHAEARSEQQVSSTVAWGAPNSSCSGRGSRVRPSRWAAARAGHPPSVAPGRWPALGRRPDRKASRPRRPHEQGQPPGVDRSQATGGQRDDGQQLRSEQAKADNHPLCADRASSERGEVVGQSPGQGGAEAQTDAHLHASRGATQRVRPDTAWPTAGDWSRPGRAGPGSRSRRPATHTPPAAGRRGGRGSNATAPPTEDGAAGRWRRPSDPRSPTVCLRQVTG